MKLTPMETVVIPHRGTYHFKRDDLFTVAGVSGGKARSCMALALGADGSELPRGLVTAGARSSPQAVIVASIARHLGIPCHVHMPTGKPTPQMVIARERGAEIIQHKPGHNSVIIKRARDDALARGWREIPFGMECMEAVIQTSNQVVALGDMGAVGKIVVPVGSGMSLAGVLHGLQREYGSTGGKRNFPPVIGVQVGADPTKRLDRYAPVFWRHMVTVVKSRLKYDEPAPITNIGPVHLDPIYEAKCIPWVEPGDLLWVVGIREFVEEKVDY